LSLTLRECELKKELKRKINKRKIVTDPQCMYIVFVDGENEFHPWMEVSEGFDKNHL